LTAQSNSTETLRRLLESGACPDCRGHVVLAGTTEPVLICSECQTVIQDRCGVISALPRMHPLRQGAMAGGKTARRGWASGIAQDMNSKSVDYSRKYFSYHLGSRGFIIRRDLALQRLGSASKNVLEAGCGPGVISPLLAAKGSVTHGVDLSCEQLRLAAENDPRTVYVQGDLEALPYKDAAFDAVVLLGVFEYLERPAAVLAELRRVTRKGGILVVSLPNALGPVRIWTQYAYIPLSTAFKRMRGRSVPSYSRRLYTLRGFERLLKQAGFRTTFVRYFDLSLTPPPLDKISSSSVLACVDALETKLQGPLRRALAGQLMVEAQVSAR
jgi:ubiquinone/menaquinone biosynthesis C-methylase UbiE